MAFSFQKYHGLGNDYLVFDESKNNKKITIDEIKKVCNRNFGFGSDGILVGPIMEDGKISMKIYNPDGTEAEKSGNGVRIFAKYLKDNGYIKDNEFTLSTLGGDVAVKFNNKRGTNMTVSMGKLSFDKDEIGCINTPQETVDIPMIFNGKEYKTTCVTLGNPHCIIPLDEISKELACEIGKHSVEAEYFPNKINTQIIKVVDRQNINIEIYERGAGYTLASGSSSCAAAGAAHKLGLVDNEVTVHMPGGTLEIKIDDEWNVYMTGSVSYIGEMVLFDGFFVDDLDDEE